MRSSCFVLGTNPLVGILGSQFSRVSPFQECQRESLFVSEKSRPKEGEIIGLLGRRCKTRLRGGPLFAIFVMICQQRRRRQRAPFLTRGILTLPPHCPVPPHITQVPPFLPFSFRPPTPSCNPQFQQPCLTTIVHLPFPRYQARPTMPPIPIIAPQPRRLLPQPTIIDPSAPVLPINLDDPFIVSAFVWSMLALSEGAHDAFVRSATHRHPRTLNFLASCLQSVFITAPSVLWFVSPPVQPVNFQIDLSSVLIQFSFL